MIGRCEPHVIDHVVNMRFSTVVIILYIVTVTNALLGNPVPRCRNVHNYSCNLDISKLQNKKIYQMTSVHGK